MDRTERFQKIQLMLQSRRVVTRQAFEEELEISRATFKRDLDYMKDRLQVPIHWDAAAGGYRLAETDRQPLPGLWFNSEELQALLTLDTLLESLQPGYFGQDLAPIRARIRQLVDQGDHGMDALRTRVRLVAQGARRLEPASFKAVAAATLDRRRLQLTYFSRTSGLRKDREVSPQRLLHYRENWYLDAWCHRENALRRFALDSMEAASVQDTPATDIDANELDRVLSGSYGIFSGVPRHRARSHQASVGDRRVCNHLQPHHQVPVSVESGERMADVASHVGKSELKDLDIASKLFKNLV
jgi:predicted DNA-binding transcriptional regulator YafY